MAIDIVDLVDLVDLPIENVQMVIFHSFVNVYQKA